MSERQSETVQKTEFIDEPGAREKICFIVDESSVIKGYLVVEAEIGSHSLVAKSSG